MMVHWRKTDMKRKTYITLIKTNLLRRKKSAIVSIMIICISFLVLLVTATFSSSLDTFLNKYLLNTLNYRTLGISTFKLQDGQKEKIQDKIDNNPYVIDFYEENFGAAVKLINNNKVLDNEIHKIDELELSLNSYNKAYAEYLMNGKLISEYSEYVGVIPELFYPSSSFQMGFWKEDTKFIDGKSLIGKDITVEYYARDYETSKMEIIKIFTYTFKVIGTYDIIPNNNYPFEVFIPFKDMQQIIDNIDTFNKGISENYNKTYNIVIDDVSHVNTVKDDMSKEFLVRPKAMLGDFYLISKQITSTGYVLGIILLFFSLLNISITIVKTIESRTGEIGLMKTIGYNNKQLTLIYILEGIIICLISFVISIVLYIFFSIVGNTYINHNISMYSNGLKIIINNKQIIINFILAITIPLISSIASVQSILRITPKLALNKGEILK